MQQVGGDVRTLVIGHSVMDKVSGSYCRPACLPDGEPIVYLTDNYAGTLWGDLAATPSHSMCLY
jgi:hypothetical protein